ncbi:MAG: conserved hypothetical membrane spanning protein [Candidatus Parvarchaeum acidophilus ARMAN-5]|jgi:hypothetical protein|uniref:Conserved hypothetical membrane spanning protein n=1 Tax=Candidatus Parvarchaeum acidophilus ARMAN-5 TaxID=662762 RepID=D6GUX1_PARA5|nr:MAG: conserved hypothetical membrane spanning protein [Candidatus Parvarchaeum acidophilus ARMAN-5]
MYNSNFTIKASLKGGLPMLFIPIIAFIAALISGSLLFLDYVHVASGIAWTGMDLFMGLFFSNMMGGLSNKDRVEISKRITPMMLFFMPSISAVTITAGIMLAMKTGIFNLSNPIIIIVLVIVGILTAQALLIFLPNELRIYFEIVRRKGKDQEKIVRLTMFNLKVSLSQVIFQMAIIIFMAHFATGIPI